MVVKLRVKEPQVVNSVKLGSSVCFMEGHRTLN